MCCVVRHKIIKIWRNFATCCCRVGQDLAQFRMEISFLTLKVLNQTILYGTLYAQGYMGTKLLRLFQYVLGIYRGPLNDVDNRAWNS